MTAPPIQEKPAKSNKKAPPTKEELHKMTVGFSRLCQQQHVHIWPSLSDLLFFLKLRQHWWSSTTTARILMKLWMPSRRWSLPSIFCLRCWTRLWSIRWIVRMRIRNSQVSWCMSSVLRVSSLVTSFCRSVLDESGSISLVSLFTVWV